MTDLFTPGDSSLVAVIEERQREYIMIMSMKNATEDNKNSTNERSCLFSRVATLPLMSEKTVQAKSFYGGIQLVETHDNLVQKRVAIFAQGTVNAMPGTLFRTTIASLSLTSTNLPKNTEVAICTASSKSWFECKAT